jgi:hypothetical protein
MDSEKVVRRNFEKESETLFSNQMSAIEFSIPQEEPSLEDELREVANKWRARVRRSKRETDALVAMTHAKVSLENFKKERAEQCQKAQDKLELDDAPLLKRLEDCYKATTQIAEHRYQYVLEVVGFYSVDYTSGAANKRARIAADA